MASPLYADVVRITISSRAPVFNGQSFGAVGPYEDIRGVAFGEIDPRDPKNAVITDIELAPKNARGLVEYRTTFTLRKPVDMTRSAGVLLYNIVNRGNHNGPEHLARRRRSRRRVSLPAGTCGAVERLAGRHADRVGERRAGRDRRAGREACRRVGSDRPGVGALCQRRRRVNTQPLPGAAGRMPATLDTAQRDAGLGGVRNAGGREERRRRDRQAPTGRLPTAGRCRFPGTPDPTRICLKNGFDPELLYELVYTAKDPYVLGVGMAAMRDVVSFFRYAAADAAGTANPIAGAVPHVIAMGNSQSGRFAKAFVNLGFNQDERGRIVWDGLNARIAGMLGSFNTRFAQPGDIAELYDPGAEGPLWWGDYVDGVRGRPAWGLLHRCAATKTCPKITETYGGPEIWYSRGSVGIAGTTGTEDLPLPDNVRRYYHPGTPHGGGPGGFSLGAASTAAGVMANNPNPERETDRALYVALVDWVVKNTPPPPSEYPRVGDGTLVPNTSAAMGWPAIPNAPRPDGVVNPVLDYDYGPAYRYNDNSGVIANVPPPIRRVIPTLVPKVDADGNEIAGVRSLLMRMPLGTYTGWNPIPSGAAEGPPAVARRRLRAVREDEGRAPRRRRSASVHRGAISQLCGRTCRRR